MYITWEEKTKQTKKGRRKDISALQETVLWIQTAEVKPESTVPLRIT